MTENPDIKSPGSSKQDMRFLDDSGEGKQNNKTLIILVVCLAIVSVVIIAILLSGPSQYEKGLQYTHQGLFNEALTEFTKVEPNDKDFKMAQSKINYINGRQAYNNGLYPQAQVYLTKVDPQDEYYHESQLMLDKTRLADTESKLDLLTQRVQTSAKDTVIIKQENSVPPDNVNQAAPDSKSGNQDAAKIFIKTLDNTVNNYKQLYNISLSATANSRDKIMQQMDSVYKQSQRMEVPTGEKSEMISELKNTTNTWMQAILVYLNSISPDNSVDAQPNSKGYKAEVEKSYSDLTSQLQKVKNYFAN